MKRAGLLLFSLALVVSFASAQEAALDGLDFRSRVDLQTTIGDLAAAIEDLDRLGEIANRVLVLDGVVESVVIIADDPNDYYAEVELVAGRWDGLERVEIYRAFAVLTDTALAGRVAERAPRDGEAGPIVRGDRVLLAARLVDRFQLDDGTLVPVLLALDLRPID